MADPVSYRIDPRRIRKKCEQVRVLVGNSTGDKGCIIHKKPDGRTFIILSCICIITSYYKIKIEPICILTLIFCIITDLASAKVVGNIFGDDEGKGKLSVGHC